MKVCRDFTADISTNSDDATPLHTYNSTLLHLHPCAVQEFLSVLGVDTGACVLLLVGFVCTLRLPNESWAQTRRDLLKSEAAESDDGANEGPLSLFLAVARVPDYPNPGGEGISVKERAGVEGLIYLQLQALSCFWVPRCVHLSGSCSEACYEP